MTAEPTNEKSKILAGLEKNVYENSNHKSDNEDSLTTAMLFAAVDKKLSWNTDFYDSQGQIVRKIMIPLVFSKITKTLLTPGNRTAPKADGKDNCRNYIPPDMIQLNQVLFDNQISVFNSILNFDSTEPMDVYYEREFRSFFVPYYQFPIPGPGQYITEDLNFDFKEYAKKMLQTIKEEVMMCDWEDPIGYNTLGL